MQIFNYLFGKKEENKKTKLNVTAKPNIDGLIILKKFQN